MARITLQSLNEQGILQKLAVSIILMAIIPLLLFLYLFYSEASELLQEGSAQLTIFFTVCAVVSGYLLSRSIVVSIIKLTKDAQAIVQGNLKQQLMTTEKNELNELAQYFNQITGQLEKNIVELRQSKKVIQDVLSRIGNALASSERIESILELTIEAATNALAAKSGVIMLLQKDQLKIMVAYGIDYNQRQAIEIEQGSGIIGWVAKEKKAVNLSRTQQDRRFDVEVRLGLAHQAIICAPLIFKEKVLGTISVHDKKTEQDFSEDDLILLEHLAMQIAVAIENNRLNQDIEQTYVETISALALAVEAKDPYSRGHSKRVNEYVSALANKLGLDKNTTQTLQSAALLHDIGKIGIRDEILLKSTALDAEEKTQMHRHAIIGENILKPIHSLQDVAYLVRHHQEQENGKGYPDGLSGKEMTLPLKILIAADAFDAMTSDRPYRKGMSKQRAKKELKAYSGIYFDPQVVDAFLEIV